MSGLLQDNAPPARLLRVPGGPTAADVTDTL